MTEETGDIPSHLESYVGNERMWPDMELSGEVFTIETDFDEVHVFWAQLFRNL